MSLMDDYRDAVREREAIHATIKSLKDAEDYESADALETESLLDALTDEADAAAALITAMVGPCPCCDSRVVAGECVYHRCRQLVDPLDS